MTLTQLRTRHPKLIYKSYTATIKDEQLQISFQFYLEPSIHFQPTVAIPLADSPVILKRVFKPALSLDFLQPFIFHLGLIELISYWKCACSPVVEIHAGTLNEDQIAWWHDLWIHGLGEFFYRNQIDFTAPDFLTFNVEGGSPSFVKRAGAQQPGDSRLSVRDLSSGSLFLIGGGKDSAIGLEVLKPLHEPAAVLLLNPTPAARAIAEQTMIPTISVHRTIDPKLLELNQAGYLNGHTPFSAYLSFLSTLICQLYGIKYAIVANESSANQPNAIYHGLEINHQYSKTGRYESRFREYSQKYLTDQAEYFSLLRPLTELQIAQAFAQAETYDSVFTSCNVNRGKGWCGHCPKCAFVYLCLFPFLTTERLQKIFGTDLFQNPNIQAHIRDLVGQGNLKPFECVGTVEESIQAVLLSLEKFRSKKETEPAFLVGIESKLSPEHKQTPELIREHLKKNWNLEHFLPEEFVAVLKQQFRY